MLLPVIQTLQFHMGQRETGLVRVEGGKTGRSGWSFVSLKSTSTRSHGRHTEWFEDMKTTVFWNVMQCTLVDTYKYFRRT
jgi:hypothetical protein